MATLKPFVYIRDLFVYLHNNKNNKAFGHVTRKFELSMSKTTADQNLGRIRLKMATLKPFVYIRDLFVYITTRITKVSVT